MRSTCTLLATLLGATLAVAQPVAMPPCGPIQRRYDVIELPGARLHNLGGTPLAQLAVVAWRDGKLAPIPFQVDEARGQRLRLPQGPEASADDTPGTLDADDRLVFMACDAGEQIPAAVRERQLAAVAGVRTWRELRIDDPLDAKTGFAYLLIGEGLPTSERRYVTYEPHGDLVSAQRYRVGLISALPNYFALAKGGGYGSNLLDGLRLRVNATFLANLAHWTFNERQGRNTLIAWTAGPVRTVRRSRHEIHLGLGIHLTAGTAHTYFYPEHVFGPGALKLPFSPAFLFRDITAFGGADLRDLRGWRYFGPGVPTEGFTIDGHMDDVERAFAGHGEWFVLARGDQAVLFVEQMSENLRQAIPLRLIYTDDELRDAPPEDQRGSVPLVGYQGGHVELLTAGRYTFQLEVFVLAHYRSGDEQRILAQRATSLTAEAIDPSDPSAGAAAPTSAR